MYIVHNINDFLVYQATSCYEYFIEHYFDVKWHKWEPKGNIYLLRKHHFQDSFNRMKSITYKWPFLVKLQTKACKEISLRKKNFLTCVSPFAICVQMECLALVLCPCLITCYKTHALFLQALGLPKSVIQGICGLLSPERGYLPTYQNVWHRIQRLVAKFPMGAK